MGIGIDVKVTRIALPFGPRETMARLRSQAHHALLESALATDGVADWSYIAGPFRASLHTDGQGTWLRHEGRVARRWDDPFEALRAVQAVQNGRPVRVVCDDGALPEGLNFVAGWIGVLGYDIARHHHRLPQRAVDDLSLPRMWWMAVDQVLAFHHATGQWWHCTARGLGRSWSWAGGSAEAEAEAEAEADWARSLALAHGPAPARGGWRAGPLVQRMDRPRFEAGVRSLREAIANGELMQANLTRREEAAFAGDAWSLYEDLAAAHPAPFCAFIEGPQFAIASCSPERFLRLQDGVVQARPIKGTAPRGVGAVQDAARRDWLAASEKNRAENLMIVDLMRNDLGRVAAVGSVEVPELFALEPHSGVWQMVSTVEARLRSGLGPADLLQACWPPGSMTGAPKLAAMQAIEALEPVRRGAYAGSVGYLDCRGHLDLSVVIRTAIVADGRVMVQVGGGIVGDSEPASEWDETVAKGMGLLGVLRRGG